MDKMKIRRRKWIIWVTPALGVFLWETIRHEIDFEFLSTTEGNMLSMFVAFVLTALLQRGLMERYEKFQISVLRQEQEKQLLKERERWAEAWHDGIAQSLFLASVQVDAIAKTYGNQTSQFHQNPNETQHIQELRQTIHHANADVRTAIAQLREGNSFDATWFSAFAGWVRMMAEHSNWELTFEWHVAMDVFHEKEQMDLHASLREGVMNIRKHSNAKHVSINAYHSDRSIVIEITDDGSGEIRENVNGMGIQIVKSRMKELNGAFELVRMDGNTVFRMKLIRSSDLFLRKVE